MIKILPLNKKNKLNEVLSLSMSFYVLYIEFVKNYKQMNILYKDPKYICIDTMKTYEPLSVRGQKNLVSRPSKLNIFSLIGPQMCFIYILKEYTDIPRDIQVTQNSCLNIVPELPIMSLSAFFFLIQINTKTFS